MESLRQQQNGIDPQEGDVVAGVGGSKDMFESVQIQVHLGSDETPRAAVAELEGRQPARVRPGFIVIAAQPRQEPASRLLASGAKPAAR